MSDIRARIREYCPLGAPRARCTRCPSRPTLRTPLPILPCAQELLPLEYTKHNVTSLSTMPRARDYRAEYHSYYGPRVGQGTPTDFQMLRRKHKSSRRRARKIMLKALGLQVLPRGQDVDHINHRPMDNRISNLRLMSAHRNRGECRVGTC